MRRSLGTVAAVVAFLWTTPLSAQLSILDTEALRLDLGGYASSFNAYSNTPYETGVFAPDESGLSAALLRFEWKAGIADSVAIDIQNRFFFNMSTAGGGGGLGLGASVPPERSLDLRSEIVNANGVLFEHDLDRLAVTFFTPFSDITLGRQAVTWGNSTLFTVGDIWTQFSPFELDTSQKRGVDALRMLSYPGGAELDVIVVDRGDITDLSGGVRLAWTLGDGDYYGAVAKNYDRLWTLMGMGVDLGAGRLHGELGLPLSMELETENVPASLRLPRATVGFDWFQSAKFTLFAEYHFNGPGRAADNYLFDAADPEVLRGERYFLGRHYGGIAAAYLPFDDLLTLSISAIGNLTDPSLLLAPTLSYALAQNVSATFGAYMGIGETPVFVSDSNNPSVSSGVVPTEYGLYPNVFFLQLSGYF